MTQNGSFKSSLKPEYYEKSCYEFVNVSRQGGAMVIGAFFGGIPGMMLGAGIAEVGSNKVCGIDVDQAIRICTLQSLNSFSQIKGSRLDEEDAPVFLSVTVVPMYKEGSVLGMGIVVNENILGKEYRVNVNNQEWNMDDKGGWYLYRENIPEPEFRGKYYRYIEKKATY